MSRYGLFAYGQGLYGQSGNDGLYDARPIFAYSFPKSYKDDDDPSVTPYLPSEYSPAAVDPDNEDYPDMFWGPSYFSQYLTDFYEQNYGQVFIEPDLGSEFFYVLLTWTRPSGDWTDLAVVKRKFGPPETVDDGTTVLTVSSGTLRNEYVEALPQGTSVYYGIFVRTTIGEWKSCGYVEAVNARNHDGLEAFFKAIPRVYTSATGGMVDVIDRRGQLSRFLQGLAFEYDYWKTQADRLSHDPGRMPWSGVASWAKQLGMSDLDLVTVGDRNVRRWLTSASTYAETKGTQNGIEAMASAITGWPVTASVSPNKMLDTDDSSGENSTGRWVATGGTVGRLPIGGTVTSPIDGGVVTNSLSGSPHLQGYVLTFTGSGTMELGMDDPVNHGIPVAGSAYHEFMYHWRSPAGAWTIQSKVYWYDIRGQAISSSSPASDAASDTNWHENILGATSPSDAAYAGIELTITGTLLHLDMMMFQSGSASAGVFYDARAIDLNIAPIRTNYCNNPSFETGKLSWSNGTQTADGEGYVGSTVGSHALDLNYAYIGGAGTQYHATDGGTFAEGDPVTASIYVKATPGTGDPTATIPISVKCLNSGSTVLSTDTTYATVPSGEWARISVTRTMCPANTNKVRVVVADTGSSANMTGAGSTLLLDGCLIEKRDSLLSYFDAAVYSDTGASKWAGTAHGAISYLYPLRLTRQSSLSRIMADYVPEPVYTRVVLA